MVTFCVTWALLAPVKVKHVGTPARLVGGTGCPALINSLDIRSFHALLDGVVVNSDNDAKEEIDAELHLPEKKWDYLLRLRLTCDYRRSIVFLDIKTLFISLINKR